MKKINWYVLKNIVYFTAVYTIIPTVILWLVQSRHIFELALGSQASILIILKISLYLIPPTLPHILPFSILLAGISVLVRLYYDSEMVVLWASGMSPIRFMKNFMFTGVMGMLVILLINAFIAPYMSRQMKIEFLNLKNDIIQTALKPSILQHIQNGNLTIYIDKISGNSLIEGFYLQQKLENNNIRIFTAKKALLTEEKGDFKILLLQGRIVNWQQQNTILQPSVAPHKNHEGTKNSSQKPTQTVLDFDKFTLNISDIISNFNNSQDLQFKSRDYAIQDLLTAKYAKTSAEAQTFIASGHGQIIASLFPVIFISLVVLFMVRPMPPRGFKYTLIFKTILSAICLRILSSAIHNFADSNLNIIYISYILHICIVMSILGIMYIRNKKV